MKKKKKSSIPLSLSKNIYKKVIYKFYTLFFVKFFKNIYIYIKIEMVSQTFILCFQCFENYS